MEDNEEVLREHGAANSYNWVSDFVYGGIDGAVTTFAVVAGVEGASLSIPIILILGFANLFADGFSMSVGKYSSDKAQIEQFKKIKAIEYEHIEWKRDHEIGEVREIMAGYGFKGKDLDKAVEVITAHPDAWVDLMMRNEFNMTLENVSPMKGAVSTFLSFIVIGFVPLLSYVFNGFWQFEKEILFTMTAAFTLMALFFVGAVKARFTMRYWLWSGLETAAIGGIAAFIAYIVGYLLRGLA
ncbi:VIT1/CCC1 transporter family protein [Candidatus Peregrinibacteria bacterium]|nr:VIT1/CCC1 transporter family protein [Candidatus Peregrinibacteria bacterium]